MSIGTVIGVPLGLQIANLVNWRFAIAVIVIVSAIAFISIAIYLPNFKMPAAPSLKDRFSLLLTHMC